MDIGEVKIDLDENSGIPMWLQLRNQLIFLIVNGTFQAGDKLPTVREIAADLGINYNTVLRVCQSLEHDGYIVSKRGKGTFVADVSSLKESKIIDEADLLIDRFLDQCIDAGIPLNELPKQIQKRIDARRNSNGER